MDDDFTKPYRKIAAAEELLEQNSLLTIYIEFYKKKFRGEPIFPVDKIHFKHIKEIRSTAKERAYALIQHFFTMKDEWFVKQAYSLECLAKNLHKVNADYSQRVEPAHKMQGKLKMQFYCEACWVEFTLICEPGFDFINGLVRCEKCTQLNQPLKRVSKEERRRTILKLGAAFPEVPK